MVPEIIIDVGYADTKNNSHLESFKVTADIGIMVLDEFGNFQLAIADAILVIQSVNVTEQGHHRGKMNPLIKPFDQKSMVMV